MKTNAITKRELYEHYMAVRNRMSARVTTVNKVLDGASIPAPIPDPEDALPTFSLNAMKSILNHVGATYGVTPTDIVSNRRTKVVALARQVTCYVARQCTGYSYPQIGRKIGRDHTTVLYAVSHVEDLMKADPDFAAQVNELVARHKNYADEITRHFAEKQSIYLRG